MFVYQRVTLNQQTCHWGGGLTFQLRTLRPARIQRSSQHHFVLDDKGTSKHWRVRPQLALAEISGYK
jgi:hypothetical protein